MNVNGLIILLLWIKQKLCVTLRQCGPFNFDPQATLQEHDDLRATSNKMSQDQKLNKKRFRFTSSLHKEQIHEIRKKQTAKISECEK